MSTITKNTFIIGREGDLTSVTQARQQMEL